VGANVNKLLKLPGMRWFAARRISPLSLPHAIQKTDGELGLAGMMHLSERRRPSIRWYARIQAFPDMFLFSEDFKKDVGQIGNSVPPLMMRAVADAIIGVERKPRLSYVDELNAAWEDHLAPRKSDAPTVVSTFAGCGGSSLGYSMAGFRELLAVEFDADACETFRKNFPDVPLWNRDIKELSGEQALKLAGVKEGELDVLDGSPPCQGFSVAGKRRVEDPRNSLFKEYVRLLRAFRPKAFVMENVPGLAIGKMKSVLRTILAELRASGYKVECRLVDASKLGVPQRRKRLIFIGIREDLDGDAEWPKDNGRRIAPALATISNKDDDTNRQKMLLAANSRSFNYYGLIGRGHQVDRVTGGSFFNAKRLQSVRPSFSITALVSSQSIAGLMHWNDRRRPTISELSRLHSFPDAFKFLKDFRVDAFQIGNSVPPLMMRALADAVLRSLRKAS
jgi:DNA (cytosine-5)-methyltransferase 1